MRKDELSRWMLVIAALIIGAGAWRAGAMLNAAQTPAPPTIAFVNLESVINGLNEKETRENELAAFIKTRQERLDKMQEEYNAASEELSVLPENSDAFKTQIEKVARLQVMGEAEKKLATQRIDMKRGEIYAVLFDKVRETTSRLAQARGFDIVVSNDKDVSLQIGSEMQITRQIALRRILYATSALDVSDELLQMMNNEWKGGS